MIESRTEIDAVLDRLRAAMKQAALHQKEAEQLLGLRRGEWLCISGGKLEFSLGREQERRARLAIELVTELSSMLGGSRDVRDWLTTRRETLDGLSPLGWAIADVAHLHAMVVCLRRRAP